jgi:Damage-control phosphatase ARMT1-like domain
MPVDLAPITGSEPGSFAHHVICERHPAIIQDVQATYPYARQQHAQLDELEHETLHGHVTRLTGAARDRDYWDASGDGFSGRRWTDVSFLWAESYFYRRLLEAVQYFEPGAWHRLDPFRAKKTRELHDQRVAALLEQLDATGPIADGEAFAVFLHGAVWGNKADLGFEMGLQAAGVTALQGSAPQLLVDDTTAAWTYLTERRPGLPPVWWTSDLPLN